MEDSKIYQVATPLSDDININMDEYGDRYEVDAEGNVTKLAFSEPFEKGQTAVVFGEEGDTHINGDADLANQINNTNIMTFLRVDGVTYRLGLTRQEFLKLKIVHDAEFNKMYVKDSNGDYVYNATLGDFVLDADKSQTGQRYRQYNNRIDAEVDRVNKDANREENEYGFYINNGEKIPFSILNVPNAFVLDENGFPKLDANGDRMLNPEIAKENWGRWQHEQERNFNEISRLENEEQMLINEYGENDYKIPYDKSALPEIKNYKEYVDEDGEYIRDSWGRAQWEQERQDNEQDRIEKFDRINLEITSDDNGAIILTARNQTEERDHSMIVSSSNNINSICESKSNIFERINEPTEDESIEQYNNEFIKEKYNLTEVFFDTSDWDEVDDNARDCWFSDFYRGTKVYKDLKELKRDLNLVEADGVTPRYEAIRNALGKDNATDEEIDNFIKSCYRVTDYSKLLTNTKAPYYNIHSGIPTMYYVDYGDYREDQTEISTTTTFTNATFPSKSGTITKTTATNNNEKKIMFPGYYVYKIKKDYTINYKYNFPAIVKSAKISYDENNMKFFDENNEELKEPITLDIEEKTINNDFFVNSGLDNNDKIKKSYVSRTPKQFKPFNSDSNRNYISKEAGKKINLTIGRQTLYIKQPTSRSANFTLNNYPLEYDKTKTWDGTTTTKEGLLDQSATINFDNSNVEGSAMSYYGADNTLKIKKFISSLANYAEEGRLFIDFNDGNGIRKITIKLNDESIEQQKNTFIKNLFFGFLTDYKLSNFAVTSFGELYKNTEQYPYVGMWERIFDINDWSKLENFFRQGQWSYDYSIIPYTDYTDTPGNKTGTVWSKDMPLYSLFASVYPNYTNELEKINFAPTSKGANPKPYNLTYPWQGTTKKEIKIYISNYEGRNNNINNFAKQGEYVAKELGNCWINPELNMTDRVNQNQIKCAYFKYDVNSNLNNVSATDNNPYSTPNVDVYWETDKGGFKTTKNNIAEEKETNGDQTIINLNTLIKTKATLTTYTIPTKINQKAKLSEFIGNNITDGLIFGSKAAREVKISLTIPTESKQEVRYELNEDGTQTEILTGNIIVNKPNEIIDIKIRRNYGKSVNTLDKKNFISNYYYTESNENDSKILNFTINEDAKNELTYYGYEIWIYYTYTFDKI